ncbi:MAG: PilT/PilU family type 4a pilus ATPase [bacterium]|nr:PilT/PilU family type 4a pilus ATPase [bacterium]
MRLLDDLLREAQGAGASDIHISIGRTPFFRIDGILAPVGDQVIAEEEGAAMMKQLMGAGSKNMDQLKQKRQVDFSYALPDGSRFRVNVFYHVDQVAAALRLIPSRIRTIDELHLPPQILQFADFKQGFVLVVGPAGQGKSTTLATLLQYINNTRREHIITIEDPIEYLFTEDKSIIDQREVGHDAPSFADAIRVTLRQDPNVIMVGEIRDIESMQTALTVAETGHLVLSTLHTNDAGQTIERIIDSFPSEQQQQVRSQLANALSGVVSQRLLPSTSGGRMVAVEIMIGTTAIKNVIRDGSIHQIPGIIQTSSDVGMQTLDSSLQHLVDSGAVRMEDARGYFSSTKQMFR